MSTKSQVIAALYQYLFKPLAFALDPELVHDLITTIGESLENLPRLVSFLFSYSRPDLKKTVLGTEFANPVGLAAGFDYDGHLAKVLPAVGFGFNTVGTVTARSYAGNPAPRLGRLPKSKSLLVNKGFKSEGADKVAHRLDQKQLSFGTLGISVGSSNLPEVNSIDKAISDYLYTFNVFKTRPYVKYFELNISCPNTAMPESFVASQNFKLLVQAVKKEKITQPIFIKMPNEISFADSDKLVEVALENGISGFIFSNLVKNRNNPGFDKTEIARFEKFKGNFSGRPTFVNSNSLIIHTRKKFGSRVAIIGCGGIFSPKDARKKLSAGADLVQLITGMIYQGPQLPAQICETL
ncbi:dihydroorotate dehydrogenase (quinone) [Candidatus Amesbacteria bacterium RIFOXYB1_FULL_44_23]|uniref:Dihydroorotate dehydrogenase (quinone) n=1 Tax=Candidatus Amesbacteria bacterium RIFOXYB1_FULL_44_23 TaxID=1797263 RepID=A0A1F4ZT66_9BACT|nr:MAG: dihydroorotate dehydrogenase (quinone) [Candidatus Amesbacteria bacterium RIFOXYB1_FULL_44_23]